MRVSPKHGVNPALGVCDVCGNETGEVLLLGLLPGDAEAPRFVRSGLCGNCKHVLEVGGVLLIEAAPGKPPVRTGRIFGITGEAAKRLFAKNQSAIAYIAKEMVEQLGLDKIEPTWKEVVDGTDQGTT